jgi:pyruvate kinase
MSDNNKTLQKVTIYRGVYPCYIEKTSADDWNDVNSHVIEILQSKAEVEDGDIVVLTKGMHKDKSGGTNLMKILCVGDGNY